MAFLKRLWRDAARLHVTAFGALTSALTESLPEKSADNNVDMIIGGQAVIEGVMMRSMSGYTVAVRQPNGEIALKSDTIQPLSKKYPIVKLPVLRGSVVLIQSLILGMRALNFAAVASAEKNEEGSGEGGELSNWAIISSMIVAFALGVGLFILAPLGITNLVRHYAMPQMSNFAYNAIDGVIRGVFFFAYIMLISLMKDIRRVFQYHGAEHKTVFTFEAHEDLTVDNARSKSTLHPRCGTSFLMFVMAISIVVFSLIPSTAPFLIKFGARVVFIPLIAGIAYEIIRFSARHLDNPLCRLLIQPGLMLQRITTQPPDDSQVEIAVVALREALVFDSVEMNKPASVEMNKPAVA